jgi:putative endonuclease
MSGRRQKLGFWGESIAADYLKKNGFVVVTRNYRCHHGEIDIIAREQATLVFIEVKTRTSCSYGSAASAVTPTKQKQISRVAEHFLMVSARSNCEARFDVIEVYGKQHSVTSINHIVSAFDLASY